MESETHLYTAGCGIKLHITKCEDGTILIRAEKSGTCKSALWQCIGMLISQVPKEKAIKILHGFECDKGIAGNKSCCDKIARMLEGK
jgi:hypothetical protein